MIKKFFITEFDLLNMSLTRTVPVAPEIKKDYKNMVVNKPWGYEYLLFENDQVAIWVLFLKQGAKTSMHCHPKKKTSLLVLEGEAKTSSLSTQFALKAFDGVVIDRGVFHSTATDFETGAFVMEIETPPEKSDLVRLKDEYGRENKGYEGESNISRDLEKYDHHNFDHNIAMERKIVEKVIKQSKIVLHTNEDWENLYKEIKAKKSCIISFLDVSLKNADKRIALDVGEICQGDWFLDRHSELRPSADTFTVLTVY